MTGRLHPGELERRHGGDLEVRGEREFAVLKVILAKAVPETKDLVDVVSAVERGKFKDAKTGERVFSIIFLV
ncbi:hypothetical protein MA16_Dca016301 [Dendrobium catenatum]|uniref:Uncharacterized protein n=1 Tax=Dendrobium catenatum TaxID=906689 RepID=A0A2I0W852_9ASPA|nr:hypothetical protein MA16_Dca016301 [Dendrobium catenatum]